MRRLGLAINEIENEISVYDNEGKYLFTWYGCKAVNTDKCFTEIRSLYTDKLHSIISILSNDDYIVVEVIE